MKKGYLRRKRRNTKPNERKKEWMKENCKDRKEVEKEKEDYSENICIVISHMSIRWGWDCWQYYY